MAKRIRSEYMKKFKDPKWETYAKCYQDLVKYRVTRRLLEQTHSPCFWDESGSDTESSGRSTPQERGKDHRLLKEEKVIAVKDTTETAVHEEHGAEEDRECDRNQIKGSTVCVQTQRPEQVKENVKSQEMEEKKGATGESTMPITPPVQSNPKSKPRHSCKPTRTIDKHHISKDLGKESRHPFAMYGSGEKQADMASKRTHNVGPAASTNEIHKSALRAKTRREAEKQMKKTDKRRAKSADLEKLDKSKLVPDYNPWMTEYMHCFSARSQ